MSYFRKGDPQDDFDRLDMEQANWLDSCPKCSKCRDPILSDDLFDFDGELICEDCIDKYLDENHRKKTEKYMNQ